MKLKIPKLLLDGALPFDSFMVSEENYSDLKATLKKAMEEKFSHVMTSVGKITIMQEEYMPSDRVAVMNNGQLVAIIELEPE